MTDSQNLASIAAISDEMLPGTATLIAAVPEAPPVAPQPSPPASEPQAAGPTVELRQEPAGPGVYQAVDGTTYFVPEAVVARRRKGRDWPAVYLERKNDELWLRVVFDLHRPEGMPPNAVPLFGPQHHYVVQLNAPKTNYTLLIAAVEWRRPDEEADGVVGQLVAQVAVDPNQLVDVLQTDNAAQFVVQAELDYRLRSGDAQIINLVDYGGNARWVGAQLTDEHNTTADDWLPWNGNDGDPRGFVRADGIPMEDGQWRPRVLRMHPKWLDRGTIKGWLPWIPLPHGARFEAELGFVQGAVHSDGVQYWIFIHDMPQGRERWLPVLQQLKRYDNQVLPIAIDLSAYGGQDISVELRVDAVASSGQDWAAWSDPRIVVPELVETRRGLPQLSVRRSGAYFPTNIRANQPIYIQVSGSGVDLDIDADWIQSPHGIIKDTGVNGQFLCCPTPTAWPSTRVAASRQST